MRYRIASSASPEAAIRLEPLLAQLALGCKRAL
jgi:hypothetical protein